ncbi:Bromodomain-containing protein 8 [Aphelenchoides fujianensis]|nr:Bromodomain-containing protein 8 [Aphelenchoides fujianensis]
MEVDAAPPPPVAEEAARPTGGDESAEKSEDSREKTAEANERPSEKPPTTDGKQKDGQEEEEEDEWEEIPEWTFAELFALLEAAENKRLNWQERAERMQKEFSQRPAEFFTVEECRKKWHRLNGSSEGKKSNRTMMEWIKNHLRKLVHERPSQTEASRMGRVRRELNFVHKALAGELTSDQQAELMGVEEYYALVNATGDEMNENTEEWMVADRMAAMLSISEWRAIDNTDDLVQKLRNGHVKADRLLFNHWKKDGERSKKPEGSKAAAQINEEVPKVSEFFVYFLPATPPPTASPDRPQPPQEKPPALVYEPTDATPRKHPQPALFPAHTPPPVVDKRRKKGAKKPAVAESPDKAALLTAHNLVVAHMKSEEFRQPVSERDIPDYSKLIKKPMDLRTIGQLLEAGTITTVEQLRDHYLLMCANAMVFNDAGHVVYRDAFDLWAYCMVATKDAISRPTGRRSSAKVSLGTPQPARHPHVKIEPLDEEERPKERVLVRVADYRRSLETPAAKKAKK